MFKKGALLTLSFLLIFKAVPILLSNQISYNPNKRLGIFAFPTQIKHLISFVYQKALIKTFHIILSTK